jgi:IPT/TIG domain
VKKIWIFSLPLFLLAGCTLSNNQAPNPAPQLNSNLSPASTVAGSTGFSLTVTGANFSANCVVLWNGGQRPTQIVGSAQAVATIAPSDVAAAGTATVNVIDTSTDLKSNTVTFVVTSVGSPTQHQATLFWTASSSPVIGYNVYRGVQAGGPYTLLNTGTVTADTFADATVLSGQTYFYVVTALSNSGVESVFSNEAVGVIPPP